MKLMLYSLFIIVCLAVFIEAQAPGPMTGFQGFPNYEFVKTNSLQPRVQKLLARPDLTEEQRTTLQDMLTTKENNCVGPTCFKNIKLYHQQLSALTRELAMKQAQVQQ